MNATLFSVLQERFGAQTDPVALHDFCAIVDGSRVRDALLFLRDNAEWRFDMLLDIVGVDYLGMPNHQGPRYAVIYVLKSTCYTSHRMRLKVMVKEEHCEVPTISDLYPIADWQERETWDQYGIVFTGHSNLKRLLNHAEFTGHPLRKDYPLHRRQWLSANDGMLDQLEARLEKLGYQIVERSPEIIPELEERLLGSRK